MIRRRVGMSGDRAKGIYDAMNKSLDLVDGEWIQFVNAGDSLFDSEVLANVFDSDFSGFINFIFGKSGISFISLISFFSVIGDLNFEFFDLGERILVKMVELFLDILSLALNEELFEDISYEP